NGDGKQDIVVGVYRETSAAVLLNTTPPGSATPSFADAQFFSAGSTLETNHVAVGDFNGDGKPDIAVSNFNGTVDILLNTTVPGSSTATFSDERSFVSGAGTNDVAVCDINGDGAPDILATN